MLESILETSGIAGGMSMLILEGIKILLKRFILKDEAFSFSSGFYLVAVPVLNILVIPLLAVIGFEGFVVPTDWVMFARQVVMVLLSSLISVLGYEASFARAKTRAREEANG